MPELPDIAAYLCALEPRLLGARLERVRVRQAFFLRTFEPPLAAVEGRVVRELRRVGKRIAIGLEEELWLVLHLMIAGRLHWRPAGAKLAGRNDLASFDFAEGSLLVTEAGTKRRASLHVVAGAAALAALDPGGIDVLRADAATFRAALERENRTLKRALTDPRIVDGIGNAYSDEILHAARLSPIALTQRLGPEEWERLYAAARETLRDWIARGCDGARQRFPEHVTAFRPDMAVHGRFGAPCPRCGEAIARIRYADNETNYSDWPRTLEELETLKAR
jgi:formamidopyrimidine-DNA glycosylase